MSKESTDKVNIAIGVNLPYKENKNKEFHTVYELRDLDHVVIAYNKTKDLLYFYPKNLKLKLGKVVFTGKSSFTTEEAKDEWSIKAYYKDRISFYLEDLPSRFPYPERYGISFNNDNHDNIEYVILKQIEYDHYNVFYTVDDFMYYSLYRCVNQKEKNRISKIKEALGI